MYTQYTRTVLYFRSNFGASDLVTSERVTIYYIIILLLLFMNTFIHHEGRKENTTVKEKKTDTQTDR